MKLPEDLDLTKVTKILHVHSADDIETIDFDSSTHECHDIVFDVKLKKTVNGVETEIQPTDLEGVTSITVLMKLPEDLDLSKVTKILHVHSANDIETIDFDSSKVTSDGYYEITISKLSEFAFIYKTEGLSTGAIVGISVGSFILLLVIIYLLGYFFCYRRGHLDDNVIRVIYKFLPRGDYNRDDTESENKVEFSKEETPDEEIEE